MSQSTPVESLRTIVKERNIRMDNLIRTEYSTNSSESKPSSWHIPKLFTTNAVMKMDGDLLNVSRNRVYERMASEIFENSELETLRTVLEKNSNRGPGTISPSWWAEKVEAPLRENGLFKDQYYMDFLYYQKSKKELGPRYEALLTTKLFFVLKAASEPAAKKMNRIRTTLIFRYICERNYKKFLHLALYKHDVFGTGFLTEEGLTSFLLEYEPFHQQYNLAPEFRNEYYVTVVLKRFFFFLDPQRTGKIKIVDILTSGLIDEMQFPVEEQQTDLRNGRVDWFSLKTANRIYHHFEVLDKDCTAMLKEEDFIKFGLDLRGNNDISQDDSYVRQFFSTRLTETFVHKLYSSVATFNNRMDFRTFTEFVLAITYLEEPQSIAYFMRIMNFNDKGYLNEFDLHYFYKEIQSRQKYEVVKFSDISNDVFDMVKPIQPGHITTEDLIRCGKGADIIKMLISMKGFENFETLDLSGLEPPLPSPKNPQLGGLSTPREDGLKMD